MDFSIRGEVFKIDFVSNYVIEKYQEVENLTFQLVDLIDRVEKLGAEYEGSEDTKELWKQAQDIQRERSEIEQKIIPIRREIVKELVESNGIEYDEKFWIRKTSPADINDFVMTCVRKDITGKGSKKK